MTLVCSVVSAKETIVLEVGNSPSQPTSTLHIKTLEVANSIQNKYTFVIEFKPGANGALALKAMDAAPTSRLATIAPAFVENAKTGLINESDYVPIASQGEACWAVITNFGDTKKGLASFQGKKRVVIGGTGYGNAAHITGIILGEKYGFDVQYIVYKANFDGLVAMAGNNGPEMVLERVSNFLTFKAKNPNLQILGINCANRVPLMPEVKTLKEQGFNTPTIFFGVVANQKMPESKRNEIGKILHDAQAKVGHLQFLEIADAYAPQFNTPPVPAAEFINKKISQMHYLTTKYKDQIDAAKR